MALQHEYTIICEYARLEFGGKWTIIGMFPNGIGAPQIPFPLPSLTFFMAFRADERGAHSLRCTLTQLDGTKLVEAQMQVQVAQPGPVFLQIPVPNLQFKAFGVYTWSQEIDGAEPILTEFNVAHVPPPVFRMMPGGPVPPMPPMPGRPR